MNFIDILKDGKDNGNDNEKLAVLYEKLKPDIVNHLKILLVHCLILIFMMVHIQKKSCKICLF